MSSPGLTRMTGGSSRPSKRKAALPVWGSLIAAKFTGERTSGAPGSRLDGGTLLGFVGLCANMCTPQSKPKHVTLAETFRLAINNQIAIMGVPSQPDATRTSEAFFGTVSIYCWPFRRLSKPSTQHGDVYREVRLFHKAVGPDPPHQPFLWSLTGCRSERLQTNSHGNKELQKSELRHKYRDWVAERQSAGG
jgi:hypothetical protein